VCVHACVCACVCGIMMFLVVSSHSRKNKILHWFEQIFASVSGEDQLLQLDELQQALGIHGVIKC